MSEDETDRTFFVKKMSSRLQILWLENRNGYMFRGDKHTVIGCRALCGCEELCVCDW